MGKKVYLRSFGCQMNFADSERVKNILLPSGYRIVLSPEEADIILIGPSRTSKTPTSVYLAYNGFKTANIPFVHGCPFPDFLPKMNNPVIFGLIINPNRLIEIRESRMNFLQVKETSNYTDIKIVQDECLQIKRICVQNDWKTIDVSQRSIEETAAIIMRAYYEHKKRLK